MKLAQTPRLELRLELRCTRCQAAISGEEQRQLALGIHLFGLAKGSEVCKCGCTIIRRRPGTRYYITEYLSAAEAFRS